MATPNAPGIFLIANSIFPYGYDAVKILALPNGSRYRARFDQHFVSEQVRRDFHGLKQRKGSYCFRDYESGLIIPLRNITIDEIYLVGSVFYIGYSVDEIYEFPQDEERLEGQIAEFNELLRKSVKLNNDAPGRDLYPLVLMANAEVRFSDDVETIKEEYDQQIRRWASIVRRLGKFKYLQYVPFPRVVGIRVLNKGGFQKVTNNMTLVGKTDYELQLMHMLQSDSSIPHSINEKRTDREDKFKERASYEIMIVGESAVFSLQRPSARMTGSYDVNTFVFRTADISSRIPAHLTIDYGEKPDSLDRLDTSLNFFVYVKPSIRFPIISIVGLFVFGAIYMIPNVLPTLLQGDNFSARTVQDLSLVAISLTAFDVIGRINKFILSRK
ncbi:hypothetical protein [Jiella sonneratiae]|uniref:Uncharacterized protein n=1 Tax=Jiella sonneratiae TaxID=2816856 RepID=A0ABS3J7F3_9HYPH|nr:hypothetical protein [Jiella sonneratiae]MBO0905596.1 hypothetical protein [Jiella sonneratiae]